MHLLSIEYLTNTKTKLTQPPLIKLKLINFQIVCAIKKKL